MRSRGKTEKGELNSRMKSKLRSIGSRIQAVERGRWNGLGHCRPKTLGVLLLILLLCIRKCYVSVKRLN
ncbi:hypothetical protein PHJA_002094500 [Phtheirospermum japonicum]|uniref:Uncharacterized protein n=1 Tax=Phtheirospermum japonicum TaxID=374723 RepID=A0A830CTK7_9LAMI|nr:hypothetical protein PHJA_002094500 [Phtheirospermum japonicum]